MQDYFVGGAKDWKKMSLESFFAEYQYLYLMQVIWGETTTWLHSHVAMVAYLL